MTTRRRRVAALLALAIVPPAAPSQGACRPATEVDAIALRNAVAAMATSRDPNLIAERIGAQIPQATDAEVTIVTDERVCRRAGKGYAAAILRSDGVRPSAVVNVVHVKGVYVVQDPQFTFGEFLVRATMSSTYQVLSRFTG